MRITDLEVDGFGVWSGLKLSELAEQLNVFYGPNEAGKTTLMQFVRSMLYGFSPERRGRYLPPVRAGRPGGVLQAVAGQKTYTFSRHADEPGEMGDAAVVSDGQHVVHDERALTALLGEVDEPIFNNVFAFGLREIQELGTLSDTQAADELYNLALGLDRVSLIDVLGELETSRNRLLAPDDRPSLVAQLLSQRQRLQAEIEELGQSTARYLSLVSERRNLDGEIARLEADASRLEQQARQLALARALSERWQRRDAIDQQLRGVPMQGTLPEDALARFERWETRISVRRRRFVRLKKQRRELRAEIEKLPINEALGRQALRLEALAEQQQWIESLEGQVDKLETEVLELESHREESQKPWDNAASQSAGPLPKGRLIELRAAAKALRHARHEARRLHEEIAAAQTGAADSLRRLESALGSVKDKGLTQALAEAGELVSQFRKRVQVDERLDQMSRRETELAERSHEHLENQILPTWALVGLGGLFMLGCALVLLYVFGLVLPASLSGALGWPVGAVGVAAAAASGLIKFGMERSAAGQLDTCHQQIQLLAQQMKQTRAEREELDARLPRGGGPLVARLQTAEKALAGLEEFLPLEAQREAAQRQADALVQQEQTARDQCRDLRTHWRQLLVQNGLPAELPPHELRAFSQRLKQLRGLQQAIDEKTGELDRRRTEYKTLSARITQVVGEAGMAPQSQRPLDQLRQCLAELEQQQTRGKRRDELARQIDRLRRRQAKLSRGANKLRQRRQLLLRAAGTSDVQEFRRRAAVQAEAHRLRAERDQLAHEISASLAGQCSEEQLADLLSGQQNLGQIETQLTLSRQAAAARSNAALERRGQMNQQLKTLLEDRQLPHKRVELGMVEKRLQDALERWRVLAVCGTMLEAVRQYYEREHQPQALREASVYLQRLTGGRYTRVWTPLGQQSLKVDDNQAQSLAVEVLSRGTREQLFLALRLALVNSYARRGVRLPLVLDDVLVNFDVGRAKAAALVLRDFAKQGHQVLIFTCHEHISKLFKHLKAEVRLLPDNAHPQAAAEEPSQKTRPGRPEIPAESEPEFAPEWDDLEAESAAADESPMPAPPARPPERRAAPRAERVGWAAEEFDGELSDRVRLVDSDSEADSGDLLEPGDDAEAA